MTSQEGSIIRNNPLRVLGVYSDTPKKEIVANLGKLRAFAKTGKILSFESDYVTLLGPVDRSLETIEKANNDISLPKDKLHAGLFWFMHHTDNDKAALECLKNGDPIEAMSIIQKKGNYSSIVNMAVLALIIKRWDIALYSYAFLLESEIRRGALVKAFTDAEDYYSEDELAEFISNILIQDFPNAQWIIQLQKENVEFGEKTYPFKTRFGNSKLYGQLIHQCVSQIKRELDFALNQASSVSRDDAKANLQMAELIEDKSKYSLKELRLALGRSNKVYVEYADNIANQILDNCIDYYTHDADNSKRARNVIKYTRYAYRTAESKTTKERAKKNLDILNETLDNLLPESIEEEYNEIDRIVKSYREKNTQGNSSSLLGPIIDEVYQIIQSIRGKVGKDNKHYISISSNFVYFASQEIVKKINSDLYNTRVTGRTQYVAALNWGRSLFDTLAKFDKDEECRTDFNNHFTSLLGLIQKEVMKTEPSKPKIRISTSYSAGSPSYTHTYVHQPSRNEPPKKRNFTVKDLCMALGMIAVLVMIAIMLFHKKENDDYVAPKAYTTEQKTESSGIINEEVTRVETPSTSVSEPVNNYAEGPANHSVSEPTNNDVEKPESYTTITFATGDRPYQSTYGKGNYDSESLNSLLIKNGSSTDAVVFLERIDGKKVRHVYIRKNDNFTMTKIPGGMYVIKIMQGTDWNPERDNGADNPKGGFMSSRSISKSESYDPFDYPYSSSGQYGQYEVTLYKVVDGNMQTRNINENELF